MRVCALPDATVPCASLPPSETVLVVEEVRSLISASALIVPEMVTLNVVSSVPSSASLVVKLNGIENPAPSVVELGVKVMLMASVSVPPDVTDAVAMEVEPNDALVGVPSVKPDSVSVSEPLLLTS